jgi:ABC-2 type transport system permease protein
MNMLHNYYIEFRRSILEFNSFKINILLANLGYVMLFWGLIDYFDNESKSLFFLLFTWYWSLHGLDNTAFILEDEVEDRTLCNILSSKVSVFSILAMRNLIQIFMDFTKGCILFVLISFITDITFQITFIQILHIFVFISITTIIMYLIGGVIGSFALVYKRVSSVSGVLYYVILFFSGIFFEVEMLSILFPFKTLNRIIIAILNNNVVPITLIGILCLQLIVYFTLMIVLFKVNCKKLYREGKVFHV